MDTCVRCGADLGVGRFCLNCGHRIGEPAPAPSTESATTTRPSRHPRHPSRHPRHPSPATDPPAQPAPMSLPVQAADPTPIPLTAPAEPPSDWDPREDLLPYEEVDDLEADAPVTGYAWVAWVLGAALLLALALVLLQTFGTDDDTASDPGSSESSTPPDQGAEVTEEGAGTTEVPTGTGKRRDLATTATFAVPDTAPPTTDLDGNLVAYVADQMNDGNLRTTWRMAGDATGQAITLTLAEPGVVLRVGLVNGYTKQVSGVDWYPNNRRILTVTWSFEDGTTIDQTFAEKPGLQMLKVPPVETGTVGILITSVTPPGSGNFGRDYTAISEVSVIGRRAG